MQARLKAKNGAVSHCVGNRRFRERDIPQDAQPIDGLGCNEIDQLNRTLRNVKGPMF
jgi:hypothetical protein